MVNAIDDVLAAIETALALITTGNDYNYTLGNATSDYVGAPDPESINGARPHIYITGFRDTVLLRQATMRVEVTVDFMGITPGSDFRDIRERTLFLMADLEKALFADVTLSGTCQLLKRGDSEGVFYRAGAHGVFTTSYAFDVFYTGGAP